MGATFRTAYSIIQRMRMPCSFQRRMLLTFNVPFFATQNKQHILTSQCFLLYIRFHTLSHSFCFRVAEQENVASENKNRESEFIFLHSNIFCLEGLHRCTLSVLADKQTKSYVTPQRHMPQFTPKLHQREGGGGLRSWFPERAEPAAPSRRLFLRAENVSNGLRIPCLS